MAKNDGQTFDFVSEFPGEITFRQVVVGEVPALGRAFQARGQESIAHLWIQSRRVPSKDLDLRRRGK